MILTAQAGNIAARVVELDEAQEFGDPERRLAVILEHDGEVEKWLKPARDTFQIHYGTEDANYNPDFVIETKSAKYIAEPKADNEMQDETVQTKARAAALWCKHATAHAATHDGKPWHYLQIPDTAIQENKTLQGLAAAYEFVAL